MPIENIPKNPEEIKGWIDLFSEYPVLAWVIGVIMTLAANFMGWIPVKGVEGCRKENEKLQERCDEMGAKIDKLEAGRDEYLRELKEDVKNLREQLKS